MQYQFSTEKIQRLRHAGSVLSTLSGISIVYLTDRPSDYALRVQNSGQQMNLTLGNSHSLFRSC